METIDSQERDKVDCQNLPKFNSFLVSDDNYIMVKNSNDFSLTNQVNIELPETSRFDN
jgi:hypothetical protein